MNDVIEIEVRGTAVVVRVMEHELDMYNVPEVRSSLNEMLDEKPSRVIIDFSNTGHLDSSALGLLFKSKQTIEAYGGKLVLTGIRDNLQMLITVTRSDKVFTFAPSIEEALAI